MGKFDALCLVILLVTVVQSRPSELVIVTEVDTTENVEVTSAEYVTSESTGEPEIVVGVTSVESSTKITTENVATESTSELINVDVTTENSDVPNTAEDAAVEITRVLVEDKNTTENVDLKTSTEAVEFPDATEDTAVKTITDFTYGTATTDFADATASEFTHATTTDLTDSTTTGLTDATTVEFTDETTAGFTVGTTTTTGLIDTTTAEFTDATTAGLTVGTTTTTDLIDTTTAEFTDATTTGRTYGTTTDLVNVTTAEFTDATATGLTDGTTTTTDLVDAETATGDTSLVTSTENVEEATTEDASLKITTNFVAHPSASQDVTTENDQVTDTTAETTTDSVEVASAFADIGKPSKFFEWSSTGDSLVRTIKDVEMVTLEDVVRTKKHEPEPIINSSMIMPCFMANVRRGISPFIAYPYDFDAELAAWNKHKLPTKIAFTNNDNSLHFVDLRDRPQPGRPGLTVKEYGDTVSINLHTRYGNGSGVKLSLNARQILKAGLDPTHPTKVIAHGFWSSINSSSVQRLINAYLNTGYYNVITVDWSPLVHGLYSSAREEANGVGDYLGQFLRHLVHERLVDPRKLHLIGHSLGAHLVGFAGKRAHQDGWGVFRITGLDPALPYFTLSNHTARLDRSDADIVDVIHTCSSFLGMLSSIGDLDFYPNEGVHYQPGCNLDVFGICSHGRAVEYFAESISEPTAFVGKFCDLERGDVLVKAANCPGNPIALMGEWMEFSQPGRYILRTAASSPYGVGLDILYPAYLYRQTRNLPSNATAVFMELHKN